MAEPKFTPGPWSQKSPTASAVTSSATMRLVAIAEAPNPRERQANARLIAAAPEVYEALERIMSELPTRRDWLDPVTERMAKAALAKARGEAQ